MTRFWSIALAALLAAAAPGFAQGLIATPPPPSSVELLPGWPMADGRRMAGLRIHLDHGWKTYWRAPGEAGVPPIFDWSGSENVVAVEVDWPRPEVFESFGFRTIGYRSSVTLPVWITARDPAAPVTLRLSMSYGVCSDICVPETADLALDIAPGARDEAPALRAAAQALPTPARDAGLTGADCSVAGAGATRRFTGAFRFAQGFEAPPVVVVEGPADSWVATPVVTQQGGEIRVEAEMELAAPEAWIDRDSLRVTFLTDYEALDLRGCAG